ncbi:hypothetical protein OZX73_03370 [Bifidobacterium sp. ESL0775]|uniref:5-methylcytosine restriction system specificity protein McrC n=1 Tax=Bifidobacterium sp. ESL0775 TaxID=2983230 RepID=UPI0023F7BC04|nr:hypothetical protein [Bifidobacterium sp. ESL0775]WEV69914.1 hypothetical protein OZX73_03370 [Bifidobacterium sp. ESL0775]
MMTYAFIALKFKQYARLETEDFDTINDLMAAILNIGITTQRKHGFEREYQPECERLHGIRGRIDMSDTARLRMAGSNKISCVYDDLSADTYKNQILKTTARVLIGESDVDADRKRKLKRCLISMQDIQFVDIHHVDWARLRFDRNNASYQLLMNVCRMVLEGKLLAQTQGRRRLAKYTAQKLSNLYERFVLEYYRQCFASQRGMTVRAKEIDRHVGSDEPRFLPRLQSDVTLHQGNKTLIIDAKCYGKILQIHYNKEIYNRDNINQIQSYVLHEAYGISDEVSGMLLYAMTDNDEQHNETWEELDHRFSVRTLNLNQDFQDIAAELDGIANQWLLP